jgi:hypothetical protein
MVVSLLELGSMVIDVDGARLDARFLDDHGAVRDSFTILKGLRFRCRRLRPRDRSCSCR